MTPPTAIKGHRAVVIGGGIAGLLSAIVLSKHFGAVTVLERGEYDPQPTVRKHAPHGAHVHVLLAGGVRALDRLVPEFPKWLDEMGIFERDVTRDGRFCYGGRWLPQVDSGLPLRPCSRPLVEHLLLRAAKARSNIEIRTNCSVSGLIGRDRVRGVKLGGKPERTKETLHADWTAIALGRNPVVLDWLEQLIGERPPEVTVDPGTTYTSCTFAIPDQYIDGFVGMADAPRFPSQPEMGIILKCSPTEWIATLIGYGHLEPPRSIEEFIERFEKMSTDSLARTLHKGRPLDKLRSYANVPNRRRMFSRMEHWPQDLIVVGDSACALNPRHGQGMTIAAQSAEHLDGLIERHWAAHHSLDGLAARYQKTLEKRLNGPWNIAMMEDRLWVGMFEGRKLGIGKRLVASCTKRMLDTAYSDADTFRRFMSVAHLLESPSHLMNPRTIAKVLFPGLRRSEAKAPPSA